MTAGRLVTHQPRVNKKQGVHQQQGNLSKVKEGGTGETKRRLLRVGPDELQGKGGPSGGTQVPTGVKRRKIKGRGKRDWALRSDGRGSGDWVARGSPEGTRAWGHYQGQPKTRGLRVERPP